MASGTLSHLSKASCERKFLHTSGMGTLQEELTRIRNAKWQPRGEQWPTTQLYPASTRPTTWQAWLHVAFWRGTGKGKSVQNESGRFLKIKCINVAVSGLLKILPWEYSGPYTKAGYPRCT